MSQGSIPEVILVNYNAGVRLSNCLEAMSRQRQAHTITIVDNASTDGSTRAAYAAFPDHRYLPLRRNVGFSRAVNLAVERSNADIVILLNPDTIPGDDFIEQITRPFEHGGTRLGAVAGTLVFETQPEVIASSGITVHRNGVAIDAGLGERVDNTQQPNPVFGASGGAAAYLREAFLEAGGFPDVFFLYLEDVDLAWRLRLRGWETLWAPGAIASHAYSASAGEASPLKRRLLARNRIWTLARCLPDELLSDDAWRIALFDCGVLGYSTLARDWPAVRGRLEAIARLAPRLCERRAIQRRRTAEISAIESWLQPSISPLRLRNLRRLTSHLAARRD
jgi:GT2 family glycosyltransferase